jgi:hypothetical protein
LSGLAFRGVQENDKVFDNTKTILLPPYVRQIHVLIELTLTMGLQVALNRFGISCYWQQLFEAEFSDWDVLKNITEADMYARASQCKLNEPF